MFFTICNYFYTVINTYFDITTHLLLVLFYYLYTNFSTSTNRVVSQCSIGFYSKEAESKNTTKQRNFNIKLGI